MMPGTPSAMGMDLRITASVLASDAPSGSTADITRGQGEAASVAQMVDYMKTTGGTDGDLKRVDDIINYVTIMPVDIDPSGVTKVVSARQLYHFSTHNHGAY